MKSRNNATRVFLINVVFTTFFMGSNVWASERVDHNDMFSGIVALEHAEIIAPLRGFPTAAGYITIWNGTNVPVYISKIQDLAGGKISLHETTIEEGIVRMRPTLMPRPIPPQSEFVMKRGGYHLMFETGERPLYAGETIPLIVEFMDGETLTIDAAIKPFGEKPTDHHHGLSDSKNIEQK